MSETTKRRRSCWVPAQPYDLSLVLFGHGWIDLAPNRWDAEEKCFHTLLALENRAVEARVRQDGRVLRVQLTCAQGLAVSEGRTLRRRLQRMLRLDEDLRPFHALCAEHAELSWVARRGAGRLLRAPSLFEDLLKLLFTTNCSWSATRLMTQRLVEALGPRSARGEAAFPSAAACAAQPESFWREEVRCGYRSRSCRALAEAVAGGELSEAEFEDPELATEELRQRLLRLPGFGPYAAGQALRLLGHHDDLALDSWCRGKLARMRGRKKPPADRTVERELRSFGNYRGLALWMLLTADWHGEAPRPGASQRNQPLRSKVQGGSA